MTFGPELSPEEKKRRMAVTTRIGLAVVGTLFLFVLVAALAGDFLI